MQHPFSTDLYQFPSNDPHLQVQDSHSFTSPFIITRLGFTPNLHEMSDYKRLNAILIFTQSQGNLPEVKKNI
jgi:hypothetical protein